ncbi:MAG TPA: hypothetical protein VGO43_10925 [Pyrinomonadaceae bacterium]|jgi:hypothetical protein|nr:hypothetical protein [Pyrinomonadaceae bacterium]
MDVNDNKIDRDEQRIAELVGSLKRVEAPGDFETRVRARIASADKGEHGAWTPFLIARIAVPAVLLIAIGGYFGFYALRSNRVDTSTQATAIEEPAVITGTNMTDTAAPLTPTAANPQATNTLAQTIPSTDKRPLSVGSKNSNIGGGSIDQASKGSTAIFPRGLDPNAGVPIASVLEMIGVDAKWDGRSWRVNSVAAGNVGERSGIKAGDVIEAVNDRRVDAKTVFVGSFTSRSLLVRRDGKPIELTFKP